MFNKCQQAACSHRWAGLPDLAPLKRRAPHGFRRRRVLKPGKEARRRAGQKSIVYTDYA